MELYVQVPHKVQQTMSREETPVLAGTLPAFEMFMTTWELLGEKHVRLKPFIDIGLEWARKYYCRMDQTRAYIVTMGESFCWNCLLALICDSLESFHQNVLDSEALGAGIYS